MADQTRARIEATLKSLAYAAPEIAVDLVYEKLVRPYEERAGVAEKRAALWRRVAKRMQPLEIE